MNINVYSDQIDKITSDFTATFGGLTQEQLNWKPDSKTWSIAQNIDHLMVLNQTYFPIIQSIRENKFMLPFIGKIPFLVNFLGKMILSSVQPDRRRKVKTFSIWEPKSSNIDGDILERFRDHQEKLKKLIVDNSDLIEKGVVISSPANKNIVYRLDKAFEIIITHEMRHFEQAKEVKKKMQN
jgi:hypothetical protein